MKTKAISLIIAAIATLIFLFLVMRPGIFNMIGYLIYQSISPEGSGESVFIKSFDIICGLLLFWIVYKIAKSLRK
ncbi:MAG TPA: hypothetical protein VK559_02295 [Ferruginibacter sp.]|nr:hypothetical protein [Ferruginibacter sp.]